MISNELAKGDITEVVKDSNLELFAKWIVEKTKAGSTVNEQKCADYLTTLVKGRIFEKDVKNWVSRARKYAYSHLSQFIVKERDKGWRVAIGHEERENTCGRIIHTTARFMDRGLLAMNALSKEEFISLAKKLRAAKKIGHTLKSTANDRIDFDEQWITLTEKIAERLEGKDANQKQLAHK